MKTKQHKIIMDNLDKAKKDNLEKLASNLIKLSEKNEELSKYKIKGNFLKNF